MQYNSESLFHQFTTSVAGTALAALLVAGSGCVDGTPTDAGVVEPDAEPDVGPESNDGGPAPEEDGGGAEPEDDGGVVGPEDAGEPDPCANADENAQLGTLALTEGWQVLNSGEFGNASVFTTTLWVDESGADDPSVMRLDGVGGILSADWFPNFPTSAEPLGNIFDGSDDDPADVFLSPSVATAGPYAIFGYTGFDPDTGTFPGKIAIVDTTDFSVRHVNAPGNFSHVATTDTIFVNGLGAGTLEGAGLYAIDIETLTVSLVGSFPTEEFAGSGYSFLTADDVIGSGYANADFENVLSATTTETLLSDDAPIDFSTLASVFVGGTLGIASHPDGFLHTNGFYDASFTANYTSVDLITVDALFTAGTPEPVVTFVDACTALGKAEALADGSLLLGITVGDSSRLVHVGRE